MRSKADIWFVLDNITTKDYLPILKEQREILKIILRHMVTGMSCLSKNKTSRLDPT